MNVINRMFESANLEEEYRISIILPVYKNGSRAEAYCYGQGLPLMDAIVKIFANNRILNEAGVQAGIQSFIMFSVCVV